MLDSLRHVKNRFTGNNRPKPRRWDTAATPEEAREYLLLAARRLTESSGVAVVLVAGDDAGLVADLRAAGIDARAPGSGAPAAAVICADTDERSVRRAALAALSNPATAALPFEYKVLRGAGLTSFTAHDHYPQDDPFVSPLSAEPELFDLYEESLTRFELKCDARDFMDLAQLVRMVVENEVLGPVCEFGSYRGHSGYLIARLLEHYGSEKELYLLDAFESFPAEDAGVDAFWNDTHDVNYEEVRAKFSHLPRVTLVKGDFTKTLPPMNLPPLALAYVDCDSYRAVKFLAETLYPEGMSVGGVMAFEDYGHPVCLGARLAVHERFDGVRCVKFFSQFSGIYVTVRTT